MFASVTIKSAPCFLFIYSPIITNGMLLRNTKANICSQCLIIPAPGNFFVSGNLEKRDNPGSWALPLFYHYVFPAERRPNVTPHPAFYAA
jgi:hypothetical protein